MTITYSQLFAPTVLTTSAATLFTAPATLTTTLLRGGRIRFTNTTAGAVTVTAHAIPSGGSAAAGNMFLQAKSIAANDYLDTDVPMLGPGGFVQALASANTSVTASALSGSYFT
jgi:hypothetical protein